MMRRSLIVAVLGTALMAVGAWPASATWSVVAVDPDTGEVGVAVASCVGFEVTVVPVLVPGVGAAASQASISKLSGGRLVEAISGGASAEQAIDSVVAADDAPDSRQFGVVVLDDGGAGWTGSEAFDVAVDRRSDDGMVSVQGNILVSDAVVDAAIVGFEASDGDLPDRLLAGLVAGADAGGDSRCGDQTATSATLIVARSGDQNYAHTDAVPLGVDPDTEVVPSVFVSVLVEEGSDRAPDRLVQAWNNADHAAESVVIRQIDDGADSAMQQGRTIVFVFLGAAALIGAILIVSFAVWVRHRRSTPQ